MIVVDASVLAHLVLEGESTEAARRLHEEDSDWCAPLMCRSELRSVATKHVRSGQVSPAGALEALHAAELVLGGRELPVASDRVLDLALGSGCSSYDCEYVALALELNVPLATLDGEVLGAFPEVARRP